MALSRSNFGEKVRLHPFRVYAGGWQSDTLSLEQNGWRVCLKQDMARMAYHMVLLGPGGGHAINFWLEYEMIDRLLNNDPAMRQAPPLVFHGTPFSHVQAPETIIAEYSAMPIVSAWDAMHCEMERGGTNLDMAKYSVDELWPQSDNPQFADQPKEIVVPDEKTVTELLDVILERQEPKQKEIRHNNRRKQREIEIASWREVV